MTRTQLDLDRIEGLAGRLTAARSRFAAYTDTPSVVYAVPGTDRLAVLRDDVLMAQYRLAEAASDLTAMITYIRELEGVLGDAGRELDEAADKFWVIHCNHPGQACGRAQEEDKQFCETMHHRMRAARDRARTALQRKTP